jgi:ABC-type Mn2+/Zn2+ transport system permease subunit
MVVPVNLAILAGQGFLRTMGLSILASIISVVLGLWLSFQLDLPSGAMIVLVSLVLFAIGLSIKKIRYG